MIFSKNINKQSYLELLLEVYIKTLGIDSRSKILIELLNVEKSDQEFIKQYFEDRDFFQVNFLIKNFEICQKIFSSTKETEIFATREINLIKNHSFFLGLRSINNTIDLNKLELDNFRNIYRKRVHYESRNHEIKWTYARIPKYGDIQNYMLALKSTQNTVDLNCRIKSILDSARYVSFYGEETEFHTARGSNKIISCFGQNNLPDGEVYFGPELYSSEGRVLINVPTKYDGQGFKKLKLNFKNGRLLEKYARVLFKDNLWEEDEGALYIGEVGLGTNPANFRFVNDILLDEKKLGSFHIALGNSYPNSFNGNRSTIHWDLVHNLQSDDHSRIIVDGYVIYNGGKYNV